MRFASLTKSDVQIRISDEISMWFRKEMVRKSKKRAHSVAASTPVETSTIGAAVSTLVETSTTLTYIPPRTYLFPAAGHVYGFGSQSIAVIVDRWGGSSSLSSVPSALEKFVGFMTSFTSQCGVQLDLLPTLFPPFSLSNDDARSHPPTGPSSTMPPQSPPPPT
ncbi:hypothetical protein M9H77_27537 [Catharanthus roseus]|uniref:Uncharacterized protein n=1 Tax=Catharanthus roseus TaxID=4058 RepID=A0ACC0ADN3_CATRO|nr:hypothetical protein M9H77_27537 [Catharanthus roseus]